MVLASVLLAVCVQKETVAFEFNGKSYVKRFEKGGLSEYTPKGQPDLETFSDMVTINRYGDVKDGEGLAKMANAVLDNYTSHEGKVIRTNSIPRTDKRPAEHFIAVRFTRPQFLETAFARFVLKNNKGMSIVYSHRENGSGASTAMGEWLIKNGETVEKKLMAWKPLP